MLRTHGQSSWLPNPPSTQCLLNRQRLPSHAGQGFARMSTVLSTASCTDIWNNLVPLAGAQTSKRLLVALQHLGLGFGFGLLAMEGPHLITQHLAHAGHLRPVCVLRSVPKLGAPEGQGAMVGISFLSDRSRAAP